MKRIILAVLGLLLLGSVVSCAFTGRDGRDIKVVYKDGSFTGQSEDSKNGLKAMVKGSIYETGEQVSVFGTCMDLDDLPVVGTYALMSSWYPNGTVFFSNVSMTQIQTSYFLYTGAMNAVQGTYLTEMDCYLNGSTEVARAYGEWQNPVWVARISGINQTAQDILLTLGNLSANISNSFEITWDMLSQINSTVLNISSQLNYVAMVANGSVDRNDSYLAILLYTIIDALNASAPPPANVTITNVTEYPLTARYYHQWALLVDAKLSNGDTATADNAVCYVSTTNLPPTNNSPMDWYATTTDYFNVAYPNDGKDDVFFTELSEIQEALSGYWYHQELMKPEPSTTFEYNVTCVTT